MSKRKQCNVTPKQWKQMPVLLGVEDVAEIMGVRPRWVNDHAAELGGRKFASRWTFSKSEIAKLLGIGE